MAQTKIPFKQIYNDSNYATEDSVSTSNCKVQLPQTCQLPDNCVFFFYITDVCIPHSWKTVEEGVNGTLYMMRINQTAARTVFEGYIVRLAPNNYTPSTFAEELQTRLRENTGSATFTVVVNTGNSGITIQNTEQSYLWKLLKDEDLDK